MRMRNSTVPQSDDYRKLSWIALGTPIFSLCAGIAFAAGHHAFYSSLEGTLASNELYHIVSDWSVSKQQINIAGGTALAFCVKACLGAGVSFAYAQVFWRDFKRVSHAVTLANIDNAFAALSNPLSLFKIWAWKRWPILFAIAGLLWILPLAFVIPPSTLSVQNSRLEPPPSAMLPVPNADFASLNFINPLVSVESSYQFVYDGPSQPVAAVAKVVSSEGQIMPISPPHVNSSWTLKFPGPTLNCQYVSQAQQQTIQDNIAQAVSAGSGTSCDYYGYIGWNTGLGWSGATPCDNEAESVPFINGTANLQSNCFSNSSNTPATLYMAFTPNLIGATYTAGQCFQQSQAETYWDQAETISCELKNSTYVATFDYPNGEQTINIDTQPIDDDLTIAAIGRVYVNTSAPSSTAGCNKFLSNTAIGGDIGASCVPDQQLLRTLSYQGIMDAFSYLFLGSVYRNPSTDPTDSGAESIAAGSGLMYTILGQRSDLQYLSNIFSGSSLSGTRFESTFTYANGTQIPGLQHDGIQNSTSPLNEAIEQLFQKVVVSLMSPEQLQVNSDSDFVPAPVNVTLDRYDNIYIYSAAQLWASYAIAIFLTAISIIAGLIALLSNEGIYSLSFSTILRVTHDSDLSVEMKVEDTEGQDPLPEHLRSAKMHILGQGRTQRQSRRATGLSMGYEAVDVIPESPPMYTAEKWTGKSRLSDATIETP